MRISDRGFTTRQKRINPAVIKTKTILLDQILNYENVIGLYNTQEIVIIAVSLTVSTINCHSAFPLCTVTCTHEAVL